MCINLASVFVDDQVKALAFYTDVLGFEKKTDLPAGEARWLTVVSPEDPDGVERARPVAVAPDLEDHLHRGAELAVQRGGAQPAEGGERLQPGRDLARRVGVHRAGPAVVTGVERRQQLDHLGAAHLADDEPVGAHP